MNKSKKNTPQKRSANNNPKVLSELDVEEIKREVLISVERSIHSGPIPSPEALQKYNKIIPDGAHRIMKMAENQSEHRISIEKKVINNQLFQSKLGQTLAFVIALVCLYVSWDLAKSGYEIVASIIGGVTILGLVSTFIYGKVKQKENLKENN